MQNLVEAIIKDGNVDAEEVVTLRNKIFADGKVDAEEAKAIILINSECTKHHESFTALFVDTLMAFYAGDKDIDDLETAEIITKFSEDEVIDERELAFLSAVIADESIVITPELKAFIDTALS